MAATGVMADFGRMPTNRKVLIFVIIGLALGLLYWRFMFKPLQERVTRVEGEHAQLLSLNNQLEADIPKYAVLRQQMAELQKTIEENQKALPTEAEIPHFFETLERKMTESGVEITKWKKGTEEQVETFVKVPVEIELVGSFTQLKKFFASLVQPSTGAPPAVDDSGVEERERIVSIENLQLVQPVVRNREIVLTAKFTAVTFRQADVAKTAPPPDPTPAGKPLPPASTPKGAKMRTEDALQKGDEQKTNAIEKAGAGDQKLKEGN